MNMTRKKRDSDDGPKMDVGLLMTVSLFLILLTFFILLNSIAVIDEQKKLVAIGSLMGAFGSLPGGLSPSKTGESIMTPFAPMTDKGIDIVELLSLLEKTMVGQVKIESGEGKEVITINERVLFGKEKSRLKPSSFPLLNNLCHIMKKGDYPERSLGIPTLHPLKTRALNQIGSFQVLWRFRSSSISFQRVGSPPRGSLATDGAAIAPLPQMPRRSRGPKTDGWILF